MLTLKNCFVDDAGVVHATYAAADKAAGKDATELSVVTLVARADGAEATVDLKAIPAQSEEEAFDALAAQLETLAKVIRGRGEPKLGVPVYG
jgi:hypothetical protein